MKKMNLKDFKKEYMNKDSKWDFKKFSIICNKCGGKKIEFNGFLESESGYYGDHSLEGAIIVKCHDCGNALRINAEYNLELNKDGEKRINECPKCGRDLKMNISGKCYDCEDKNKIEENMCRCGHEKRFHQQGFYPDKVYYACKRLKCDCKKFAPAIQGEGRKGK